MKFIKPDTAANMSPTQASLSSITTDASDKPSEASVGRSEASVGRKVARKIDVWRGFCLTNDCCQSSGVQSKKYTRKDGSHYYGQNWRTRVLRVEQKEKPHYNEKCDTCGKVLAWKHQMWDRSKRLDRP
jgi:hypothetical protein